MKKANNKYFVIIFLFIMFSCSPRTFNVVLYDNHTYKETNIDEIIFIKSRLDIKEKYFEIGIIKATKETSKNYIREIAAKNGANIVINEENNNYTMVRYKEQKKENYEKKNIKT